MVADVKEVTVFGSAAICPWIALYYYVPENEPDLHWLSDEVDIDLGNEDLTTLVDGTLGEGSMFQETHRIYAHGVSSSHFIAPPDWRERSNIFLEPLTNTRILTPAPVDLAVSKLVRGQEKDWEFAKFCHQFLDVEEASLASGLHSIEAAFPAYTPNVQQALGLLPFKLHQ